MDGPISVSSVLCSRRLLYSRCTVDICTCFLAISSLKNCILEVSCLPEPDSLFWLICRFSSLISLSAARFLARSPSSSCSSWSIWDCLVLCCLLSWSTSSLSRSLSVDAMLRRSMACWMSYSRLLFSSSNKRFSFSYFCAQALLWASICSWWFWSILSLVSSSSRSSFSLKIDIFCCFRFSSASYYSTRAFS